MCSLAFFSSLRRIKFFCTKFWAWLWEENILQIRGRLRRGAQISAEKLSAAQCNAVQRNAVRESKQAYSSYLTYCLSALSAVRRASTSSLPIGAGNRAGWSCRVFVALLLPPRSTEDALIWLCSLSSAASGLCLRRLRGRSFNVCCKSKVDREIITKIRGRRICVRWLQLLCH